MDFLRALCGFLCVLCGSKLLPAKLEEAAICRNPGTSTSSFSGKRGKTFPKLPFAGQMLSHYERAVINPQYFNKPFTFIRLHI
jgi:hypothetical protein